MLLINSRGTNHHRVVSSFTDELQTNRKFVVSKSAGHRQRRQSTKIPDAP
jgi:hypothetical protein